MRKSAIFLLLGLGLLFAGGCIMQGDREPLRAVIVTEPAPPRGDPPLTVRFSAAQSTGEIDEYIWQFGDGNTATGSVAEHTYTLPGNYTVTLRVVGPQGEDTARITVHVNSALPEIEYFEVDRTIVHATHQIYFYATAHDPDGEVRFFHWDFGNGETAVTSNGDIGYAYPEPGTFTVTVRAEDDNGDLSEPASVTVQVLPPCPCD
ncbi:MAG: PKD domain-containing protein [Caldiserica bacterium]|nr:PKD domain-containing protein [Caldisericota bacterium]